MSLPLKEFLSQYNAIALDSRKVGSNSIFVALKGHQYDGVDYITDAIANGASAIMMDAHHDKPVNLPPHIALYRSQNIRADLAHACQYFYPNLPKNIIAVTGTNGKSSCVEFIRQLSGKIGYNSASLGTLGMIKNNDKDHDISDNLLTTNDIISLYRQLAELGDDDIDLVALEASSHGLHQGRLQGLPITQAVFTNLSQDHLDYHHNMDNYAQAKAILFNDILLPNGQAVINKNADYADMMINICQQRQINYATYAIGDAVADLCVADIAKKTASQDICLSYHGQQYDVSLNLIGDFFIENLMAAILVSLQYQGDIEQLCRYVPYITAPLGRMQMVAHDAHQENAVFVDYAHTPDSLMKALQALRPHTQGRLMVVFGCGGDRDQAKRAIMGDIAHKYADIAIITDDNPRHEDPTIIRNMIAQLCPHGHNIAGRGDAIGYAIDNMRAGDQLLIAGKGHENYQIIGDQRIAFSDQDYVRDYLS